MRDNPMVNLAYFRDIKKVNDDADGRFINAGNNCKESECSFSNKSD